MSSDTKLTKDEECESVDSTKYQGMIGSLLYLTASRPNIMFSVCHCARFQEARKTSHLEAVKRIFQYIKGTMHLGLWYPKGTGIETIVYADSDHARDYVDRKSTSDICTFVGCCITYWFLKKQTALAISTTQAKYVSVEKAKLSVRSSSPWKRHRSRYDQNLDRFIPNRSAIDFDYAHYALTHKRKVVDKDPTSPCCSPWREAYRKRIDEAYNFCNLKFLTKIEVSVITTNEESVKDMTSKFDKLAKFEGQDFRRRQKKMHFLLTTLKVVYVLSTPSLDDKVAWWVDSGAISHVCKDLRWFQVCKSIEDGSFVKMGNVATEPIKGIVRVLLTFTFGKTLCLDNVLYVPGIQKNLVSEIVLNKCGYKQVLESDKYILSRHGSFLDLDIHNNSLSKSKLWHARLGHVHYKKMRDMSKMSLIPAFDMTHESCKTCMLTKITRQPLKSVNRESKVLDLIHSDLFDFHANPSLGHNKYVITFIDDASRYCYVYLLHVKHEALDKFKIYKQEVELQRQDLIKVLRTDRGVNSIIESIDAIFDEERFTSIPRPRGLIQPSLSKIAKDEVEGTDDVPGPSVPRKSTITRKAKSFGFEFQLYLVKGTRDKTLPQREYCLIIKEDPRTLSEAMASRDVSFWKEAIQ
nr:zinc finger, CCHC-type [Tanacetum cinerariifolium]